MKMKFQNHFDKVRKLSNAILALGALICLVGFLFFIEQIAWFAGIGAVIMFGSATYYLLSWVCPFCGSTLARNLELPTYCSQCGRNVNDFDFKRQSPPPSIFDKKPGDEDAPPSNSQNKEPRD